MPGLSDDIKRYQDENKYNGFQLLDEDTVRRIDAVCEVDQTPDFAALRAFRKGDYTKLNTLPKMLQDYALYKTMEDISKKFPGDQFSIENPNFREYLEVNGMNPLLQTGLEMYKGEVMVSGMAEVSPERFSEAVSYLNVIQMKNTLDPVDRSVVGGDGGITAKDLNVNIEKQATLATSMFLTHLGNLTINPDPSKADQTIDEDTKNSIGPVSELFTHGGRTMFILPRGENGKALNDAITGRSKKGVVEGRALWYTAGLNFATHDVKVSRDANGQMKFEEKKATSVRNNTGMNVAIGGLGKKFGPNSQWTITNKGRDGHVYMKVTDPDRNSDGYILMGIEGEAPGEKGRLGNKHDASAKKAPISSFGSTKHTVGRSYDGRRVDFRGKLTQEELKDAVETFRENYCSLQRMASFSENAEERKTAKEKLERINLRLCGKPMEPHELLDFVASDGLNMDSQKLAKSLKVADYVPNPEKIDSLATAKQDVVADIKKNEATKTLVNPKLWFLKDRFEIVKKEIKKDPAAKKLKSMLDNVLDAETHRDEEKYEKDLYNMISACKEYVEFGTPKSEIAFSVMKDVYKECRDQYVATFGKTYEDRVEEIETYKKDLDDMKGFQKSFADISKSTWKDSPEFKTLQEKIGVYTKLSEQQLKTGEASLSDDKEKALLEVYRSAVSYLNLKNGGTDKISEWSQKKMDVAENLLAAFKDRVEEVADKHNFDYDDLMATKLPSRTKEKTNLDEIDVQERGGTTFIGRTTVSERTKAERGLDKDI